MQASGKSRRENADSHPHYCHAPRMRGIQNTTASRLKHGLWNTWIAPSSRATTTEYAFSFSRQALSEAFHFVCAPKSKKAQGRPGARCTRGLVCI